MWICKRGGLRQTDSFASLTLLQTPTLTRQRCRIRPFKQTAVSPDGSWTAHTPAVPEVSRRTSSSMQSLSSKLFQVCLECFCADSEPCFEASFFSKCARNLPDSAILRVIVGFQWVSKATENQSRHAEPWFHGNRQFLCFASCCSWE